VSQGEVDWEYDHAGEDHETVGIGYEKPEFDKCFTPTDVR
jgi:hypothetical protein